MKRKHTLLKSCWTKEGGSSVSGTACSRRLELDEICLSHRLWHPFLWPAASGLRDLQREIDTYERLAQVEDDRKELLKAAVGDARQAFAAPRESLGSQVATGADIGEQ